MRAGTITEYAFDALHPLQHASFVLYAHLTLACEGLYFEVYTGLDKLESQLRLAIDFEHNSLINPSIVLKINHYSFIP